MAAYAPPDHDPLDDALTGDAPLGDALAGDSAASGGAGGLAGLDLAHRKHAQVEDGIRGAKDTGARNLPCETFERNAVWLQLVMMAQTLMAWTQALTLDGQLRKARAAIVALQAVAHPGQGQPVGTQDAVAYPA